MPIFAVLIALAVGFVVAQAGTLVTTVYLHRTLSHRAMKLNRPVTFTCRVLLWIATGIRPRQWVAVHRKHHAYTDVPGDPHSPVLLGWTKVQFGNVGLYRKVATDPEQVKRYARDLPPDRWDRVLFDHAFLGLAIGISILVVVFGPWIGLLAAGFHAGLYLMLNAAVNAVTHTFGRRPYDNLATNLPWLAWLTMGEGLHNNHHAAPTSAKLALHRGEVDPAWWVVAGLRKLRWAEIRHDTVKLKEPARAA
jgi:stearoyl-CoA desaturase (delta-9 desaturase)